MDHSKRICSLVLNGQNFIMSIDVYALGTSSASNLELSSETTKQKRSVKKKWPFPFKRTFGLANQQSL